MFNELEVSYLKEKAFIELKEKGFIEIPGIQELDFSYLKKNYIKVLDYCLCNSDSFSLLTYLKKPYHRGMIIDKHAEKLVHWKNYLIKRKVGINEWPGTLSGSYGHALYIYDSQELRKKIFNMPNLFQPIECGWPEDICFYRNDEAWFVTTSHEEDAYMISATVQDLEFFKSNGIIK